MINANSSFDFVLSSLSALTDQQFDSVVMNPDGSCEGLQGASIRKRGSTQSNPPSIGTQCTREDLQGEGSRLEESGKVKKTIGRTPDGTGMSKYISWATCASS